MEVHLLSVYAVIIKHEGVYYLPKKKITGQKLQKAEIPLLCFLHFSYMFLRYSEGDSPFAF